MTTSAQLRASGLLGSPGSVLAGLGVSPQLFSCLHHYQVPRVADFPAQLVIVLLVVVSRSPVDKPFPCRALGQGMDPPTSPLRRHRVWCVCASASPRGLGCGLQGSHEALGTGVGLGFLWLGSAWGRLPPSHGRPGPPAFGYSSWPGKWLKGQGDRLQRSNLCPLHPCGITQRPPVLGACPRLARPSSLTIVQLSSQPQSACPEIGCLVPCGNKGCLGPPGPSPP